MISFKQTGDFSKTIDYFMNLLKNDPLYVLETCARQGVIALAEATPKDTGLTADSWDYNIIKTDNGYKVEWTNSNIVKGIPVAILIEYGHGTRGGAYVQANDFINPALAPIFEQIAEIIWEEVTQL